MYVLPGHQGAGVGGLLLESFVQKAKQSNSVALELTVLESSIGAVEFYQSNGFVEINKSVYEITRGVELSSLTMEFVI